MLENLFYPISMGGWVSWALFFLGGVLWYNLGFRFFSLRSMKTLTSPRSFFSTFEQNDRQCRRWIQSIIIVSPLLGLLGTVIGMIETFSSLQDQAMHSQGGGIAAGISQALITTQMGLLVAIPGLIVGRQLDKMGDEIENTLPEQAILQFDSTGILS